MDPLVDKEYYKNNYHGEVVEDVDWDMYYDRAFDVINEFCDYYFDTHEITNLPLASDVVHVKKAVCAQIEYFVELGGSNELTDSKNAMSSVTVGKFSMSKSGSTPKTGFNSIVSSVAIRQLRPTGLLYRGLHHGR